MEKYSVLMSLYYKEDPQYLKMSFDSILNQTVKPDEIVLVEDGPLTEELYNVINDYKDYLNIVVNESNLGLGLALNEGLKNCRNELVARMDTDDIAVENRCEKQLRYFETHPHISIVGGQIEEFINNPKDVVGRRIVPTSDNELKEYMKRRCPFNHMTVMFKKSDVLRSGNYQDWFWNEDYYLWIRMALNNMVFGNLDDILVYVRVGEDMYARRGGKKYFISELGIQNYLLKQKMISYPTYYSNCLKRIIVQMILPNKIRGWVFRKFARTHS